ncbi:MAG TPA: glutamate ABC transporter substrate-binding protein [Longimicrobiales bacterium]|nr:glutamate ABC transporter substrate-binding protein [Longimicrobiales bacterium]
MRNGRHRTIGVIAFLATILTAACGDSGSAGDAPAPPVATDVSFEPGTTMAALNAAQRIRVGTKFDQPLFGLLGLDGQMAGFDIEIAKLIAAELGIPASNIQWVEAPSPVREELLEQGTVDIVVATYTINDRRRERVSFAGPYYIAGQDLMVRAGDTSIGGPEDLRGTKRVCSVQGSTPSVNIREYVDERQLTLFDVYSRCADALRTNQVDVVTTDNVVLMGLIEASNGAFELVGKPFTVEPYGIGIRKGDVAFCEFINDVLRRAAESGRYQEAWARTAGTVAGPAPELPEPQPCS